MNIWFTKVEHKTKNGIFNIIKIFLQCKIIFLLWGIVWLLWDTIMPRIRCNEYLKKLFLSLAGLSNALKSEFYQIYQQQKVAKRMECGRYENRHNLSIDLNQKEWINIGWIPTRANCWLHNRARFSVTVFLFFFAGSI